jgi:hypothetical protein
MRIDCRPAASLCTLQDAPYTLEAFTDGWSEEAPSVKLALLTACAKLFFKRAPECRCCGRGRQLALAALLMFCWAGWRPICLG